MKIGVGAPNPVPGAPGRLFTDWARRAEERGFSGLVTIDRVAWRDAGREGEPRLAALVYFSLGEEVAADSRAYLHHYYGFLGPYAEMIADGALRSDTSVRTQCASTRTRA